MLSFKPRRCADLVNRGTVHPQHYKYFSGKENRPTQPGPAGQKILAAVRQPQSGPKGGQAGGATGGKAGGAVKGSNKQAAKTEGGGGCPGESLDTCIGWDQRIYIRKFFLYYIYIYFIGFSQHF